MSNIAFDLNNINNMGVGYLFEKELNIQDVDINKMLEDIDSQLKSLSLKESLDNLKADLFNSEPKEAEPDFWAMTEEWAKHLYPEMENIEVRSVDNSHIVEPVNQQTQTHTPVLEEVKQNKISHNADQEYITKEAQHIRAEKPEVVKHEDSVMAKPEHKAGYSNKLTAEEKHQRESDVGSIILDREVKMHDTHAERLKVAKETGNLKEINQVTDRNRIEEMEFKVSEKNIHSQYLTSTPLEAYSVAPSDSEKRALGDAKYAYYEKYGEGKFTKFLSKDDIEMGGVQSQKNEKKHSINSDRSSPRFGQKNNTIDITHPDLDYALILKKSQETNPYAKQENTVNRDISSNKFKQPADFFNNFKVPGENKTMREYMDWQKNPENPRSDSNKFSSHWNDAKNSMNKMHDEKRQQMLLNHNVDDKIFKQFEQKTNLEKQLFNFHEKEAMVEERLHFAHQNNNLGYLEYKGHPEKAKVFAPTIEEKQNIHNAYKEYYLESKDLVINNDNISQSRQELHQAQTKDLMASSYNSTDWNEKLKVHAVENFQQDYIDGKTTKDNYENVLRENFEPGKNYDVRLYNTQKQGFDTMKFTGQPETKVQEQAMENTAKQEQKMVQSVKVETTKQQFKTPNVSEVNSNISNMRSKRAISSDERQGSFTGIKQTKNVYEPNKKVSNTVSHKQVNPAMSEYQNKSQFKSGIVTESAQKTPNQSETLGTKQPTKNFDLQSAKKPVEIDLQAREDRVKSQHSIKKDDSLGY